MSKKKTTSINTIMLIILRELRYARGACQYSVAEACGKSSNAWTKIETGRSPMSFDVFCRACTYLGIPASSVIAAAERYVVAFNVAGWKITMNRTDANNDTLMNFYLNDYPDYTPNRGLHREFDMSILNGPIHDKDGVLKLVPVFDLVI